MAEVNENGSYKACKECGGSGYQARGCNLFPCAKCGGKGVETEVEKNSSK